MNYLKEELINASKKIHKKLDELLPKKNEEIFNAIRYSALPPGKCIRGFLLVYFAKIFQIEEEEYIILASVIELIHTFTLIHDDLPALDNDDIRRGKLSNHKKFNEAIAILAGDGALILALQILGKYFPELVSYTCSKIAEVIEGQSYDLKKSKPIEEINNLKTGAMFVLCCSLPAILKRNSNSIVTELENFGYNFGKLFQLVDDIQDSKLGNNIEYEEIMEKLKGNIGSLSDELNADLDLHNIVENLIKIKKYSN